MSNKHSRNLRGRNKFHLSPTVSKIKMQARPNLLTGFSRGVFSRGSHLASKPSGIDMIPQVPFIVPHSPASYDIQVFPGPLWLTGECGTTESTQGINQSIKSLRHVARLWRASGKNSTNSRNLTSPPSGLSISIGFVVRRAVVIKENGLSVQY